MKRTFLVLIIFVLLLFLIPYLSTRIIKPPAAHPPTDNALAVEGSKAETPTAAVLPEQPKTTIDVILLDRSESTILRLSAREYMIGAVACEMPPSFHSEALKAQAISALSYAYFNRQKERDNPTPALGGAYLSVSTREYLGYSTKELLFERWGEKAEEYYEKICRAVDAVAGRFMMYDGEPIAAAYHAISSGVTETSANIWGGSLDYLMPVISEGDKLAAGYRTIVPVGKRAFLDALSLTGEYKKDLIGECKKSPSGTVLTIEIGDKTYTGTEIRALLDLRSACFDMDAGENGVIITTYGYGHGVGLSQNGADFLARQGYSYDEILKHYYKGIEVVSG